MNLQEAVSLFKGQPEAGGQTVNSAIVRTRGGCEYHVTEDVVEMATSGWRNIEGAYVYGTRTNGTAGGPFRRSTQGEVRWFLLKNVTLVEDES